MAPICISKAEVEQGDCAHQLPSLGSMPEVPDPKTNVLKLARESFSGAFQKAASVLGPGVGESACRHFKELCFSLPYSCPVGLWSGCFGGCLSGTQLKVGVWTLRFSGWSSGFWVPFSFVWGWDCVSDFPTCFDWFPSCLSDVKGITQLVFRCFSEELVPGIAVDLVCLWGGDDFKIFISCYLELKFCICFPKRFNFFGHFQLRASLSVLKMSSSSHYAWVV